MAIQTDEVVRKDSIDFQLMASSAMAAGFNPLSVLRAGAAAGFGVSTQTSTYYTPDVQMSGVFTQEGPSAPTYVEAVAQDIPPPVNGTYYTQDDAHLFGRDGNPFGGGSVHDYAEANQRAENEYQTAMEQAKRAFDGVVTDGGRWVPTQPGTVLNPISYIGAASVQSVPASKAMAGQSLGPAGEGFQPKQVYETDKIPNVITGDTRHYILPGVPWREQGGTTRGEGWNILYGDDGLPNMLMPVPKFLNDLGGNMFDWYEMANGPTWVQDVEPWIKQQMNGGAPNAPNYYSRPMPGMNKPAASGGGW